MTTGVVDDEVDTALSRVRPLLGLVAQHADGANAERRPAQPVIDAFGDAGLMRLVAPAAYGGHEAHPEVLLAVVEAVAAVDGSTGWTVMTCNEEMGIACAFLPAATMSALVRERPDVVIAGSGLTSGRARRAPGEDGWLVSGRWRFVTGCPAADMIVLGNLVDEAGGGPPSRSCYVLVPRSEVAIEDTWKVAGMRGTGSHDVVLDDRFVADRWAGVSDAARGVTVPDTAFFRLPYGLRFPFPKVGVAAGIARAAIASFVELAGAKTPVAARSRLCDRASAQAALAEATALVEAGRALVSVELARLWATAGAGEPISAEQHARCRLACSYSVSSSVSATELVCREAGSTANFDSAPFARQLADVRAVAQHFMVAPYQMATAGRVLIGLDSDDPSF